MATPPISTARPAQTVPTTLERFPAGHICPAVGFEEREERTQVPFPYEAVSRSYTVLNFHLNTLYAGIVENTRTVVFQFFYREGENKGMKLAPSDESAEGALYVSRVLTLLETPVESSFKAVVLVSLPVPELAQFVNDYAFGASELVFSLPRALTNFTALLEEARCPEGLVGSKVPNVPMKIGILNLTLHVDSLTGQRNSPEGQTHRLHLRYANSLLARHGFARTEAIPFLSDDITKGFLRA
jgi:hypothetical protein